MIRTFAEKPKASQQTTSAKSTKPSRPFLGQSSEVNSIIHLQRTIGNQAVQRLLQFKTSENPWQEGASGQAVPFEPDTGARPVLRYGTRGEDVIRLQRRLNLHGADIVEDGIWGPNTNAAVTAFQAQHGLAVDGIVGPLTWAVLDRNPQAAEPTPPDDEHSVLGVQGDPIKDFQPAAQQPVGGGPQKEPSIADVEKYGPGPFASFVADDRLDRQAACLLHYMALAPAFSWARDTPEFIHQELSNGNLLGIVKASEAAKMAAKAHSSHRAAITATQPTGGGILCTLQGPRG
ncbi:peptidoglycan-binding domain-containing protein [Desulfobacter curvatus]|uniref:peptidoglycan-binding domain-containing protein n=1 Tax=Desulfobacter curvatus TaxID=2290 RepID=UPI00037BB39F|nr:peptidoglycan-binding protein [Desulfobacter curvatus]